MTASNSMTVQNMAEEISQQTLMVNRHVDGVPEVEALSNDICIKNNKQNTSADILQQALDEADGYEQNTFSQTQNTILQENIQHLTDHSYIHTSKSIDLASSVEETDSHDVDSIDSAVVHPSEAGKDLELQTLQFEHSRSITEETENVISSSSFTKNSKICESSDSLSLSCMGGNDSDDVFADETVINGNALVISENTPCTEGSEVECPNINQQFLYKPKESLLPSSVALSSRTFDISRLKLPPKQTNAPVGSVDNPIQIIQHENSYHSTQLLTQAQLQQISHVLQRQQDKKIQNGGKSILYDPATNTRIVCRVVHPAELRTKNCEAEPCPSPSNVVPRGPSRGRGRPKKFGVRRLGEDEMGNSVLSKEERAEKKKQRPRTRSGRISKPPSYMVKDYKRIHHLDFDDEANNSDGGYSDYHVSDEENDRLTNKSSSLTPGVTTSKQRNYSCHSCNKAYIGRGGLSRHYRLNPTHGSLPEGEDASTQDENSNSSLASSVLSSSGGNTSSQNIASAMPQTSRFENECQPSAPQIPVSQDNSVSERRKAKLREVLRCFTDEELLDVFLPKFAQIVPLWDFFLRKCEEKSEGLQIFEMLKEFEKFLTEMQRVSLTYLSPASSFEDQARTIINISSKQIAEALSLETGAYFVKDVSSIPSSTTQVPHLNVQCDISNDLAQPHAKRKRIEGNVEDISARLPEQILSDAHEASIELPLSSEHFSQSEVLHDQDIHAALTSTLNKVDITANSLFDLNSSTTVTPSSLSSGCLSAVNSPKMQKTNLFFAANSSQLLQNMQVRKVQPQELARNSSPLNVMPPDFSLGDMASRKDVLSHRQLESTSRSLLTDKGSFQSMSLGSNINELGSCQGLQQSVGLCSNPSSLSNAALVNNLHLQVQNSLSEALKASDVSKDITVCLPDAVGPLRNSVTAVSEIEACVPSSMDPNTSSLENNREFEIVQNEIVSKASEPSSQVLRHLMLPDGQVIAWWSHSEKPANDQNYLPRNLLILQNSGESLQVPNDQGAALDTLQTMVPVDPGLVAQSEASTYKTVHM